MAVSITPVERRRLSDVVVEQITHAITVDEYRVGEKLPSERELAQSLGVSRALIRESFRILEAIGLVEVKPGIGAIVAQRTSTSVNIAQYLWQHPSETLDVIEIRDMISRKAGELAARHITNTELETLEALYDAQQAAALANQRDELMYLDRRFHVLIFTAARNTALSAIEEYSRSVLANVEFNEITLSLRPLRSLAEHERIIQTLRAHDPKAAAAALGSHARRANAQIRRLVEMRSAE